ncbi:MAG: rhamnosyltransferase [Flavobacteriales bacterium]|nr:rhamnosyltransferase [Flavobacteriales bacterium]|tara:strand:+ start:21515 stop:22453 length:939 start_codon:yes stop_codon:yes gene_type:complete
MNRLKETGVCIPTFNAMSSVTFVSLIKLLSDSSQMLGKLLIIDSSSSDKTVEFANSLGVEAIVIPVKEFDHGSTREMGCKILSDKYFLKYVIFLTQDAFLESNKSLENIVKPFDDNLIGAVCGRQIPHVDANLIAQHSRLFNYQPVSRVNTKSCISELGLHAAFMSNSFAAYNISILFKIGGFPKTLIFGEDMYVAAKMILNDFKTCYCSDAVVRHSHNYSLFDEFRRYFDIGVFHATNSFLLREFNSPKVSGFKYLFSELQFTLKRFSLFWFCNSLLRSMLKFLAYNLGKNNSKMSKVLNKKMSMNSNYWN